MYFSKNVLFLLISIGLMQIAVSSPLFEFKQKASLIPHPQKAYRGGQDAYFSDNQLLIVADGVGSWNEFGVNPAFYSRFLCQKGSELFAQDPAYFRHNLIELIAQSQYFNEFIGSSTMAALTLQEDELRTCYIGDSGFIIFRLQEGKYKLHFEFAEQQHEFNFPYQLALAEYYGDDPYLSICEKFKVQENDIVVVGSDGLFDNVYCSQILDMINENILDEEKLFGLAQTIAKLAIQRGQDLQYRSPFSEKAKQKFLTYLGGKLDDTTVIISKIKKIEMKVEEEISKFEQAKKQADLLVKSEESREVGDQHKEISSKTEGKIEHVSKNGENILSVDIQYNLRNEVDQRINSISQNVELIQVNSNISNEINISV